MLGVAAHFLLTRTWPRYARHSLPWKLLAMMMIPTAAFFTTTDVAAMELDREFAQQFSITPRLPSEQSQGYEWNMRGAVDYFRDNQYKVIGYGWLSLVGLSLAYNFTQKHITLSQKLINARLVAQSGAMAGIVAVAALHIQKDRRLQERDLHFERVIGDDK
ncbi:hypothetical protein HDU91_001038 [Kappamyces sp. JEL0680]|nr:hypothetical protein HDU91_001038 [Kappamyces sp. JEL0680]